MAEDHNFSDLASQNRYDPCSNSRGCYAKRSQIRFRHLVEVPGNDRPLVTSYSMSRWRLVSCRQSPLFIACFRISAFLFRDQFGPGRLRKRSAIQPILGGAALQRCDNRLALNGGFSRCGQDVRCQRVFPQPDRSLNRLGSPSQS
jgi:hypothetical protein